MRSAEAKAGTTLFPYGAATLAEVMNVIRTQCTEQEVANLEKTIAEWREASKHFQNLIKSEAGEAETIGIKDTDASVQTKLEKIASDPLFKQAFSMLPTEFRLVEIGKIVAPQRLVNLDYVRQLRSSLPKDPITD